MHVLKQGVDGTIAQSRLGRVGRPTIWGRIPVDAILKIDACNTQVLLLYVVMSGLYWRTHLAITIEVRLVYYTRRRQAPGIVYRPDARVSLLHLRGWRCYMACGWRFRSQVSRGARYW